MRNDEEMGGFTLFQKEFKILCYCKHLIKAYASSMLGYMTPMESTNYPN